MVSTHLKDIGQDGNLPQIGVKIKNAWNHHIVFVEQRCCKSMNEAEAQFNARNWFKQNEWWMLWHVALKKTSRRINRDFQQVSQSKQSKEWDSFIQIIWTWHKCILTILGLGMVNPRKLGIWNPSPGKEIQICKTSILLVFKGWTFLDRLISISESVGYSWQWKLQTSQTKIDC